MTEDFVSFELAKKLKEKGYNKPFYFYYRTDDQHIHHVTNAYPLIYSDKIDDEVIIAPAISQVLKWLREEKKIHIMIAIYSHYPQGNHDWGYEVINLQTHTCEYFTYEYSSYEAAAIAGIEYVIDNLI